IAIPARPLLFGYFHIAHCFLYSLRPYRVVYPGRKACRTRAASTPVEVEPYDDSVAIATALRWIRVGARSSVRFGRSRPSARPLAQETREIGAPGLDTSPSSDTTFAQPAADQFRRWTPFPLPVPCSSEAAALPPPPPRARSRFLRPLSCSAARTSCRAKWPP